MPPVGFEPTISAGERPQTYALDYAATGTGNLHLVPRLIMNGAEPPLLRVNNGLYRDKFTFNL